MPVSLTRKIISFLFVVFATTFLSNAFASGNTYYICSGDIADTNNWYTSEGCYSGNEAGTLPGSGDTAYVTGSTTFSNVSIPYDLIVNSGATLASSGAMTVENGGSLTVNYSGIFTLSEFHSLILESGSTYAQNNTLWYIDGSVIIKNNQTIETSRGWEVRYGGLLNLQNGGEMVVNGNLSIDEGASLTSSEGSDLSFSEAAVFTQQNTTWTTNGSINLGNDYTLASDATWNVNGILTIVAGGNFVQNGSFNLQNGASLIVANTGSYDLNGILSLLNGSTFTQNNTTWSLDGDLIIENNQAITAGHTWSLTTGSLLRLNGGNLTVNTSAILASAYGTVEVLPTSTLTNNGIMDSSWTLSNEGAIINNNTSTYSLTVSVGDSVTFDLPATTNSGANYNTLNFIVGTPTYSATGLPAGLSINETTGVITGTPTGAGSGTVLVTANVLTLLGNINTTKQAFSYTVSTPGAPSGPGDHIARQPLETSNGIKLKPVMTTPNATTIVLTFPESIELSSFSSNNILFYVGRTRVVGNYSVSGSQLTVTLASGTLQRSQKIRLVYNKGTNKPLTNASGKIVESFTVKGRYK